MKRKFFLFLFSLLTLSACLPKNGIESSATSPTLISEPTVVFTFTSTKPPFTQTPVQPTSTTFPVSAKDLAGLIISSPILGTPQEVPETSPPNNMTTPNGLGIINSDGELIKFADAGLFEGISPSGDMIVYQYGYPYELTSYVGNLNVYDITTGKTVEILDDLDYEGGKTVISWLQDETKVIYYHDLLTVLFEAYGYFRPKQLFLADIKTGQTNLLLEGYQFDVSPDGMQIAYTTGEILASKTIEYGGSLNEVFGCFQPRIYSMASGTSFSFDITSLSKPPICLGYPKWSPDGNYIAWIGYFEDDKFYPVIFNLKNQTAEIYQSLEENPSSSLLPTSWLRREEPLWVDASVYWAVSYEVNVENGKISTPREVILPYAPWRNKYIQSPNGLLKASLNSERDQIFLMDNNENFLSSFTLESLYSGERYEIVSYPFGVNIIEGWSPDAPP
jgi:hypothetical protein